MRALAWKVVLVFLLCACRGGGTPEEQGRPPFLQVRLIVASNFPTALVGSAEIVLAPAGEEAIPFHPGIVFDQVNGVPVTLRTQDEDGDGRPELIVSYAASPFQGQAITADIFLYPVLADSGGDALASESPPVQVVARLFTRDGALLATGESSIDIAGQPVRFGVRDRTVQLILACVEGAPCDTRPVPVPPGKGEVMVSVARARDCPEGGMTGDLHVFLLPGAGFPAGGEAVAPLIQRGVSFASPETIVTFDRLTVTAGPYIAYAVLDVGGDSTVGGTVALPGDLGSEVTPIQVVQGRATALQILLDRIQGLGFCTGGGPQAPAPPRVTGTIPASPANDNNPRVVGSAEAGATVRIHADLECRTAPLAQGTAGPDGAFEIPVTVPDNGTTVFAATAANARGFASPCSPTRVTYIEDSLPPSAPTSLVSTPPSPASANDLVVSGAAEAGAQVLVFRGVPCTGDPETTVVANAIGLFSAALQVADNTTTTFFFLARDAAGNASSCSAGLTYVEDSRTPDPPDLTGTSPASPSQSNTPTVVGTAAPGARVEIFVDPACAAKLGEGIADAGGSFGVPVNVADNSTTHFFGKVVSPAGNESVCSTTFVTYVEDSRAPDPPALSTTEPGSPAPSLEPTVRGGAEAGSTVRLYAAAGCAPPVVGSTTADSFGAFAVTARGIAPNAPTTFFATAEDPAGNVSACSAGLAYRHDSIAPAFGGAESAIATSPSEILLSWAAAADAVTPPERMIYDICRSAQPGGCNPFVRSDTTPPGATSLVVGGLAEGTRYYFVVRARDEAGNSDANLGEVTGKTLTTRSVQAVASGSNHACALLSDGQVRCWGDNAVGQLGDGTTQPRSTPVVVPGLTQVIALSARASHTCALLSNGSLRCWGANGFGQLGDGTTSPSPSPVVVTALPAGSLAIGIAAGDEHTCALLSDGTARCWGRNVEGQLGSGATSPTPQTTSVPVAVPPSTNRLSSIAAGARHTCALRTDGRALCWGANNCGQVGNNTLGNCRLDPRPGTTQPTPSIVLTQSVGGGTTELTSIVAVAAGSRHSCAVLASGRGMCWGRNEEDQLGTVVTEGNPSPIATPLGGFLSPLQNIFSLALGDDHGCAVIAGGTVSCWGLNSSRQLGDRTTLNRSDPVAVTNLTNVARLSLGRAHSCALRANGTIRCWGDNAAGQIGDGTNLLRPLPTAVVNLTGVSSGTQLALGASHSCGLIADAKLRCWGRNSSGQLGDGTTESRTRPVEVTNLPEATAVSAGISHTCAVLSEGTVRCWGANSSGQIGDGTSQNNRPVPVGVRTMADAFAVAAGGSHTCALTFAGILGSPAVAYCWGSNASGQLGDDTTADHLVPQPVSSFTLGFPPTPVSITAGVAHTCVGLETGEAMCWGSNSFGQLGRDFRGGFSTNPGFVIAGPGQGNSNLDNVVALSAGGYHTCALRPIATSPTASAVMCWGYNEYGQVGDGTTTQRDAPVPVSGLNDAVAIASGLFHSCALLADGTVRCWGLNTVGQLGNDAEATAPPYGSPIPVQVVGVSNAVGLAAGGHATCALLADGRARCWGSNAAGQLGLTDPTVRSARTAQPVEAFP